MTKKEKLNQPTVFDGVFALPRYIIKYPTSWAHYDEAAGEAALKKKELAEKCRKRKISRIFS